MIPRATQAVAPRSRVECILQEQRASPSIFEAIYLPLGSNIANGGNPGELVPLKQDGE
jgi:hypothetical protein